LADALDIRIAHLGIVVQTTSAVLLAATFLALRHFAPGRKYFTDWSRALVALAIALTAVLLRYETVPPFPTPGNDDPKLMRTTFDILYQAGKFAFFGWLLIGARRFAGRDSTFRPVVASVGLLTISVISCVALSELNPIVWVQSPIAIATSALAARAILTAPPERRSFGSRASGVIFIVLALLWAFYLVSFSVLVLSGPARHPSLITTLGRYNSFIDVLVQSALGFALVITLFQDLERKTEAARTERAELESRLAVAQKLEALGVLVSGVAHELNNPLTSILGFSDVAAGNPRLPADLREPLRTISEQAHRCRVIVRGLLDAARQRRPPRLPIRLRDVVSRVVRGMTPQINRAAARVTIDLPANDLEVHADPTGLEQVFSNLLSNALDASPWDGCIRISARPALDDRVVIRVEDDGPGIPAAIRGRIFEPFFTTKDRRSGTGLGLAISRRILQAHGGTLTLVERDDGRSGAAFDLALPRQATTHGDTGAFPIPAAASETPVPVRRHDDPPTDAIGTPRILVVDDEKPFRELLQHWLRQRGHSVLLADNGQEALALLRTNLRVDAIVTDLRMPVMTGMELFDHVAISHPQLAACTIAITGDALSPNVANFVRRRACVVLEKPLDFARLADELERRLAHRSITHPPEDRAEASG
jgi:signal transduction histidine kinase/ActR/RegA family two-component response regulator